MTKKEFVVFAAAMKTYFPKEGLLPSNEAMSLWYEKLKDIPYNVATAVLDKWVDTNKWPPTIAEIRELAAEIQHGEILGWADGWEQVLRAIKTHGMYNEGAALRSMDELTRKAVKRLGFREICLSENIGVDRANFRMIYEQLADRKKVHRQMPQELHMMIDDIRNSGMIECDDTGFKRLT